MFPALSAWALERGTLWPADHPLPQHNTHTPPDTWYNKGSKLSYEPFWLFFSVAHPGLAWLIDTKQQIVFQMVMPVYIPILSVSESLFHSVFIGLE